MCQLRNSWKMVVDGRGERGRERVVDAMLSTIVQLSYGHCSIVVDGD